MQKHADHLLSATATGELHCVCFKRTLAMWRDVILDWSQPMENGIDLTWCPSVHSGQRPWRSSLWSGLRVKTIFPGAQCLNNWNWNNWNRQNSTHKDSVGQMCFTYQQKAAVLLTSYRLKHQARLYVVISLSTLLCIIYFHLCYDGAQNSCTCLLWFVHITWVIQYHNIESNNGSWRLLSTILFWNVKSLLFLWLNLNPWGHSRSCLVTEETKKAKDTCIATYWQMYLYKKQKIRGEIVFPKILQQTTRAT